MGAHTAQAAGQQAVLHRGAKRRATLWKAKPLAPDAAMHKAAATQVFRNLAREGGIAAGKLRGQLIPDSTWKRAGEVLGPSASQTMARLANALFVAERIWRNEGDAIRFLLRPHVELGKVSPYSLLNTESGGRAVENLLAALEYGFPV